MEAIRYYLMSNPKRHLPGLTHAQKTLVARQSAKFTVKNDKLLVQMNDGKVLEYVENLNSRKQLIEEIHR
jgi:hypothetical protein